MWVSICMTYINVYIHSHEYLRIPLFPRGCFRTAGPSRARPRNCAAGRETRHLVVYDGRETSVGLIEPCDTSF